MKCLAEQKSAATFDLAFRSPAEISRSLSADSSARCGKGRKPGRGIPLYLFEPDTKSSSDCGGLKRFETGLNR